MWHKHQIRGLAATGILALAVSAACAQNGVTYRFNLQQTNFLVGVGQSVSLPVYLEETTTGTASSLLLEENGVASVGVRLARIGAVPTSPARFAGPGAVHPNTANFFPPGDPLWAPVISVSASGAEARLLVFARGPGVTGNSIGGGVRTLFLGNLDITAGNVPGEVTTIQTGDYAGTADTVTWTNLLVLDAPPYGITPAVITVTAIGSPCYANCDNSTGTSVLTVNDFLCFQGRFALGDIWANCDGSTAPPVLNVNDFICFQGAFASGCP